MRKIMIAIGAAALLAVGCAKSSDNADSGDAAPATPTEALAEAAVAGEQPPMAASPKLDTERIVPMVQQEKITAADYDFLLTQLDVIG